VGAAGCPRGEPHDPSVEPTEATRGTGLFDVDPATIDFAANPTLRHRLLSTPHGYFRFINRAFAREVCSRFEDASPGMPVVNLHGDPHVEQYAVTSKGSGLSDFDYAAQGAPVLDLVRLGTSIHLAAHSRGWGDRAAALAAELSRGYTAALDDPKLRPPEPGVAARLRTAMAADNEAFLDMTEALMDPVEGGREQFDVAHRAYVQAIFAREKDLSKTYFDVKRLGASHSGIGSALSEKYLARVEGPTEAAADDVIIEAKAFEDISPVECMGRPDDVTSKTWRDARLVFFPYRLLAPVQGKDKAFWLHAWLPDYEEVSVEDSLRSAAELGELAYVLGVVLARGHLQPIGTAPAAELPAALRGVIEGHQAQIEQAMADLARETIAAWQRFKAAEGLQ
jgi:hypothetical protein